MSASQIIADAIAQGVIDQRELKVWSHLFASDFDATKLALIAQINRKRQERQVTNTVNMNDEIEGKLDSNDQNLLDQAVRLKLMDKDEVSNWKELFQTDPGNARVVLSRKIHDEREAKGIISVEMKMNALNR